MYANLLRPTPQYIQLKSYLNLVSAQWEGGSHRVFSPPMKKILLEFDEDTYADFKREAQAKAFSGNMWGLLDAFIVKLVDKVDAGDEEWTVIKKNKERD